MAFRTSGANAVLTPGATTQPFKTVGVVKSQQNTNTQTNINNTGTLATIMSGSDGGATDAAGTFAPALELRQIAPGAYTLGLGPADDAVTAVANPLQNPSLTASQAPGAPNAAVTAASPQININTVTQVTPAQPPMRFLVADTLANSSHAVAGTAYTGPAGVSSQYVVQTDNPALSAANLNITALAPGVFIHTGSGIDAISVAGVGGRNILDGGANSNFLVGGAAGSGADTFFVDASRRSLGGFAGAAGSDVWSTIANFHAGDAVTLFGITPASGTIAWADGEGATGATGLTLHATQAGAPRASFTLAGYTTADLGNGCLGVTYGTEPDGTPYLHVVGLK